MKGPGGGQKVKLLIARTHAGRMEQAILSFLRVAHEVMRMIQLQQAEEMMVWNMMAVEEVEEAGEAGESGKRNFLLDMTE
jgi:hypothetical protein